MMKRLIQSFSCMLAALLFVPMTASAQTGIVTGTVTDAETETTIPGASVLLQPAELGGTTDADGLYEIADVPTGEYTLLVSFVGYQDYEQSITVEDDETVTVDVALQPAVQELEEVTVTGYRADPTEEVTGSVSTVTTEEIEEQNVQTASEALQGKASGVRVTSQSGAPGAAFNIQVRGQGSINAGDSPIYIVDGVQVSVNENNAGVANYSKIAGVDPSNIESIRVLKDAAAASIYGARAANGVVLIDTKQGTAGDTRVNFQADLGAVTPLNQDQYEVLNAEQFGRYLRDAASNQPGITYEGFAQSRPELLDDEGNVLAPNELENVNWFDAIRRTGITQNYTLSLSGGNEDTRFYLSGGYETLRGQFINKNGAQYNLQAKLDHSLSENLDVGANVNLSTFSRDGEITGNIWINSAWYAPYYIPPYESIYTNPDAPENEREYSFDTGTFYNGVALTDYTDRTFNSNQIIGNLNLSWTPFSWLTARSQAGLSFEDQSERTRRDSRIPAYAPGSASTDDFRELTLNLKQLLNYDFQFGEVHGLSGLAGVEYRREFEKGSAGYGENFANYRLRRLSSAATNYSASQYATESRLLSFLGEAEYDYDNRYVFRVTGRYDGSSRFGANERFGLFGSVSGAWRLSEEAFMSDVDFVNQLKLRASYGILGNSQINDFVATPLFSGGGQYIGNPGLAPSTLGNVNLTWEESRPLEVGLDFALFGTRLSGSVNAYNKITDQLLINRDLTSDSGFGSTLQNVGSIQNRGLEVSLSTINVDTGGFRWSTNFNISFLDNEVLDMPGGTETDTLITGRPGGNYYVEGEPLAQWYFREAAGVNPADGRPMFYDGDGNLVYEIPDFGDQETTDFYGNQLADFYGGLTNTFSYKGLSLSAFFQFDYGRVADNTDLSFQNSWNLYNKSTEVLDYWQEPGDVTDTPAPALSDNGRPGAATATQYYQLSTWTLQDASYIRLKQLRLDYELPASLLENVGVQNASVFVMGRNLLTFTNYLHLDPEMVGETLGQYPQNTTYTTGVNVTF